MDQVKARRPWYSRGATIFVTGAAVVALLPIGAAATTDYSGGLPDLAQEVANLAGQGNTNSSDITTLKSQVAQLQATQATQAAQIAALQKALADEAAARQAGDASTLTSANAHSDSGDAATLASAKSYTDSALLNLNLSGSDDDSALLAAIAAETSRAQNAESGLQFGISQAEADAQAGDSATFDSAVNNAVGIVETNLVILAGQSGGSGDTFVATLAGGPF